MTRWVLRFLQSMAPQSQMLYWLTCKDSIAFEIIETAGIMDVMVNEIFPKVSTSHVHIVNSFLEYRIPGVTKVDFDFFEEDLEFNDFETIVDTATISDPFTPLKIQRKKKLKSMIRSAIGVRKKDTLKCNLITFEKRNFNADTTCRIGSSDHIADLLFSKTREKFFAANRLAEVQEDPIGQNKLSLSEWMDKRDGGKLKSLLTRLKTFIYDIGDMTRYKLMVKADAKPKLDETPLYQYVTGQNIVFQDKALTALFSHCFTQCTQRLKYVSEEKCCFFVGSSNEEFADLVSGRLGDLSKYYVYELDISKYDKSQASLMKDVEYRLLHSLGFHNEVLDAFFSGEYDSMVTSLNKELNLSIYSQRRSGGANTWLGNTLVLLTLLSVLIGEREFDLALCSGDDSLIFFKEPLTLETMEISATLGFDVKLFEQSVPYFCSKYFVQTPDRLHFVPDPFKLLYKLGVERDFNEDLLHEVFTSFTDMTKSFFHEGVISELVKLDARKYGENPFSLAAFSLIHVLASNFNQFKRLYYDLIADGG
uniref:RNA-dependent RNA polymerase n=1 Tax=Closteroviridae sp. TaxID=2767537 RepID=A0A7U3VYY3_9CLOS|nr:RNA-dependent RNA polymerase [Closteroviridae sp.]UVT34982.1 protein 1b [peony leafroll-associated virus]